MPAISDQDLERLADRIVERVLIRLVPSERGDFVDASAIARRFSLSRVGSTRTQSNSAWFASAADPERGCALIRASCANASPGSQRTGRASPGGRAAAVGLPRSKATCCPFEAAAQS